MKTIQSIRNYTDNQLKGKENKIIRKNKEIIITDGKISIGDIYSVKDERAKQICGAGLAFVVWSRKK